MNPNGIPRSSNYLELLKKVLIDYDKIDTMELHPLDIVNPNWKTSLLFPLDKLLRKRNFSICKLKPVTREKRMNGLDWPASAKTMIGYHRLSNIEYCIKKIQEDEIEGDLIETGVWRGGSAMFMKAVLNELNITNKKVWLADSFNGVPHPKKEYSADQESRLHKQRILSVSREEVEKNFRSFELLDENIEFLEGWFSDTLSTTSIKKLCLLRLDGDLYESTYLALKNLYPKLSKGGFVIIDDHNAFQFCKEAVQDFRSTNKISEEIIEIDKEAIFWRKVD